MKNYLRVTGVIFLLIAFLSCDNEEDEKLFRERGYLLYCWPSKTPCENREKAIEFSYWTSFLTLDGKEPAYPRVATLVCCRYLRALIDTLTEYNRLLVEYRHGDKGNLKRSCMIGPDIEVYVEHTVRGNTEKPSSTSALGFKDNGHTAGFNFSVPSLGFFEAFLEEFVAKYRECCGEKEEDH